MRIHVKQTAIPLAIAAMVHGAKSDEAVRKALVDLDIDIKGVHRYSDSTGEPNVWLVLRNSRATEMFEIWI